MDFRPDNIADVIGLILASALFIMAYMFTKKMEKNEASGWEQIGHKMVWTALFFTIGMAFTLSTIIFTDDLIRESINLIGNLFWMLSAYFAYIALRDIGKTMEVIFGG